MNWPLVLRGVVQYTALYGGGTVGLVYWATESDAAVLGAAFLGLMGTLFVVGGGSGSRGAVATAETEIPGSEPLDETGDTVLAVGVGRNVKAFFYGVGLVAFSVALYVV
ncbi:hypothetical protein [Halorussus sp. MSC15.2]|uniref:hypothetical protein n=1 Tax=Halorussus sp. MSC15.2 TaxID=2283638 RepID=UPI0013D21955|nr:hypothetical protein [Halorussus sp. MSC15.2]NEU57825.1 hypothetical protein [Halorussus sp. MSC15.2]